MHPDRGSAWHRHGNDHAVSVGASTAHDSADAMAEEPTEELPRQEEIDADSRTTTG